MEPSERDICTKFITPALVNAGWNLENQIFEEYRLTLGRIEVRGSISHRRQGNGSQPGDLRRADYLLCIKPNIPVAVIEAKRQKFAVHHGIQQALEYANAMGIPFAISTNGKSFLIHDRRACATTIEREIPLDQFPTPQELHQAWAEDLELDMEGQRIVEQDYAPFQPGKNPRYYQVRAVNAVVEAIASGRKRVLLVMATGAGKTFTSFQIIHRIWKSGRAKRILFLVDRTALASQTKNNDFKPFEHALTWVRNGKVDKSREIFIALYQGLMAGGEDSELFQQFSPGFFDLVVIDECHRGSANENSEWRKVLDYFSSAIHVGLTATPKETKDVSNTDYFGEAVYTYSLKQGIEDGYLAPYKVVRIHFDRDSGWRPELGQLDECGEEVEDRLYDQRDYDRNLILSKRTKLAAKKVTEFLKRTDPYQKTIVFCQNVDHAARMRIELINENPELVKENERYVVQITGGQDHDLDDFAHPERRFPVIATTSDLLSTGVDIKTCKVIVIDRTIESMTKFKQIIGRGTRIDEDHEKFYFTIIDFRGMTKHFADPEFDGMPVQIYEPNGDDSPVPPADNEPQDDAASADQENGPLFRTPIPEKESDKHREKHVVNDVSVSSILERTQYYRDGKLVTEDIRNYTRRVVRKQYETLDDFLQRKSEANREQAIREELLEHNIDLNELEELVGRDYSAFDLICHIVFDQPPLTRKERVEGVRKSSYFTRFGEPARKVLDALLDKYADEDATVIEDPRVLRIKPFSSFGTPEEIVEVFGGSDGYRAVIYELENRLYAVS